MRYIFLNRKRSWWREVKLYVAAWALIILSGALLWIAAPL